MIGDVPYAGLGVNVPYSRITEINHGGTVVRGAFSYDNEGHVTGFTDYEGVNDTYTFVWSAGDRLDKQTDDGAETYFYYDPAGRLIAKGTHGDAEIYFYDGGRETLRFDTAGTLKTRSFYSAGQLAAVDEVAEGNQTYWTLADAQGTIRDAVHRGAEPNELVVEAVDYDDYGNVTTFEPSASHAMVRHHGRTYHGEYLGYYDGAQWTSPLLDGRTLAPTGTHDSDRYGVQDPSRPDEQVGFLENPYRWLVNSTTDRLLQTMGDAFWANLSDGEYFAVQAGAVGISFFAGLAAPLAGGASLTGAIAGGAVSGAIEAGGTYAWMQAIGEYSDARNGTDNAHGSLGQFFTETFVGAAGGALTAGAFGVGGRLGSAALRPLATEVRQAAMTLGRRADDFFTANPRLNPFNYQPVAGRGMMLGANLSKNFKVKYVGPRQKFYVAKHGDMPSPRPGQQSHHGVMSAWMERHFPTYDASKAPAILMPEANHRATFGVYLKWRKDLRQMMGGTFDWNKVSEDQMKLLSAKMFKAAKVPWNVQRDYWSHYNSMIEALRK